MDGRAEQTGAVCFSPSPEAVRGYLLSARQAWDAQGWSSDLCDLVEQVLAEVLNNIAEHAHPDQAKAGETWVSVQADGDTVVVDIRDNGLPMPGLKLPEAVLPDVSCEVDDLPEGGFGWYMIHLLASSVDYARVDGWNTLRVTLKSPD